MMDVFDTSLSSSGNFVYLYLFFFIRSGLFTEFFQIVHVMTSAFQKWKLISYIIFVIQIQFRQKNSFFFIQHIHNLAPWISNNRMSP